MAQPAAPAPAAPPTFMTPPNFKELAPGTKPCAFYEKTLVRRVFTIGMWILTAVFGEATRRHAITALSQRQAQFALIALAVVDVVLLCLPKSKNDPAVRLQIREKVDNTMKMGSALNLASTYAEEIKLGIITPDEVKSAVLVEVQKKGFKVVLASDANRATYLAQLQTYKKELQQLFEAELAISNWETFFEKHGAYALHFWDDSQAPAILTTRVIEHAKAKSLAVSDLNTPLYLLICKKIPNGEQELTNSLVAWHLANFNNEETNYYTLRNKIGLKNIPITDDGFLKPRLKASFLKLNDISYLQDQYAEDRKLLGITFQECLEGLSKGVKEAYSKQLRARLVRFPEEIEKKKDQMAALEITCQSIHIERWKEAMGIHEILFAEAGTSYVYMRQLESPHELKDLFKQKKRIDSHPNTRRFIDILHVYPVVFELGIFSLEDQEIVDKINEELLKDEHAFGYLDKCEKFLDQNFVKKDVMEAILQRHYHKHLLEYCKTGRVPNDAFTAGSKILENSEVGKILLELSQKAEPIRMTFCPTVNGRKDTSAVDAQYKALMDEYRPKIAAVKVRQG